MNHRHKIESEFGSSALTPPIFYNNPGGLRFELSVGGTYIHQFLTAHKKANEICSYIFDGIATILLCAEYYGENKNHDILKVARSLKELQLWPKVTKQHWFKAEEDDPAFGQHFLCYEVSVNKIENILWSNLASDLAIMPKAQCRLHIFDFNTQLHVFPYDDRGMDIVGPNHKLLKSLSSEFHHYLFEYDIEIMKKTFR